MQAEQNQYTIKRLKELNEKNKDRTEGYSLGDTLLLDRFEKNLVQSGMNIEDVKKLSPSYYT